MKTMHLFAGVGGGLLADRILGHDPIIAVEWDRYACQVLRERAADGWFPNLSVWEGDVRLFNPSEYAGQVDCIHAGFPCQDISVAGNQAGLGEGTRSGLYREVLRIAGIIKPRQIFLETCQQSLVTDSEPYSQTWPRWGMTAGGFAYAHPMSERRITGIGGGDYVPTPTCNMVSGGANHNSPTVVAGRHGLNLKGYVEMFATPNTLDGMPPKSVEKILAMNHKHRPGRSYAATNLREQVVHGKILMWPTPTINGNYNRKGLSTTSGDGLATAVKMWPTPTASDNRDRGNMSDQSIQRRIAIGKQIGLSTAVKETQIGGTLNPTWVEWLMGFPIEWTNSKDWAMLKCRSNVRQLGNYSEANK